jgi:hypothetical protein
MPAATRIWSGAAADNAFDTAGNWDTAVPVTGDSAVFPAMGTDADKDVDGSDQSAILLVNLYVESGSYVNFGDRLAPVHVDADAFVFEGMGDAFFQLDNCAVAALYSALSSASDGGHGFSLTGASNTLLLVDVGSAGTVDLAMGATQTTAFTTIEVLNGRVFVGAGVTMTTFHQTGGMVELSAGSTTFNMNGGTATQLAGIPATLNVNRGTFFLNSATTLPAVNVYGGLVDLTKDSRAKTITACTMYGGVLRVLPNQVTFTNAPTMKGGSIQVMSG